jgi:hypothetical protein
MAGNTIALWVAACALLLLCSSLSGESSSIAVYSFATRRHSLIASC